MFSLRDKTPSHSWDCHPLQLLVYINAKKLHLMHKDIASTKFGVVITSFTPHSRETNSLIWE